jgi:hypothetical protein
MYAIYWHRLLSIIICPCGTKPVISRECESSHPEMSPIVPPVIFALKELGDEVQPEDIILRQSHLWIGCSPWCAVHWLRTNWPACVKVNDNCPAGIVEHNVIRLYIVVHQTEIVDVVQPSD